MGGNVCVSVNERTFTRPWEGAVAHFYCPLALEGAGERPLLGVVLGTTAPPSPRFSGAATSACSCSTPCWSTRSAPRRSCTPCCESRRCAAPSPRASPRSASTPPAESAGSSASYECGRCVLWLSTVRRRRVGTGRGTGRHGSARVGTGRGMGWHGTARVGHHSAKRPSKRSHFENPGPLWSCCFCSAHMQPSRTLPRTGR